VDKGVYPTNNCQQYVVPESIIRNMKMDRNVERGISATPSKKKKK
jgi:hypothetical protein